MYINTHSNYSQPALLKLDNENIGGHRFTFTARNSSIFSQYCSCGYLQVEFTAAISSWDAEVKDVEMHDEIFHFEIFKNFMKFLNISRPFFKIFHKTFNFQY